MDLSADHQRNYSKCEWALHGRSFFAAGTEGKKPEAGRTTFMMDLTLGTQFQGKRFTAAKWMHLTDLCTQVSIVVSAPLRSPHMPEII